MCCLLSPGLVVALENGMAFVVWQHCYIFILNANFCDKKLYNLLINGVGIIWKWIKNRLNELSRNVNQKNKKAAQCRPGVEHFAKLNSVKNSNVGLFCLWE